MQSCQKLGTILLNKFPWEWFMFKILLMKVVLLIKYSDKKIIFRKIQLSFGLQNWLWKLKMSNFWQSSIKMPYKITKNPFRWLIQMQKSIEFQLHHWEIPQLSTYYCRLKFVSHPRHFFLLLNPQFVCSQPPNSFIADCAHFYNSICFHFLLGKDKRFRV